MYEGTLKRIIRERGFGFILAEDERDILSSLGTPERGL